MSYLNNLSAYTQIAYSIFIFLGENAWHYRRAFNFQNNAGIIQNASLSAGPTKLLSVSGGAT